MFIPSDRHRQKFLCIHCKNEICRGIFLRDYIEERAEEIGQYIVESGATVRQTAKKFGVSKSTVHKDVTQRLKQISPKLYEQVKKVLEKNKQERHIRGGLATKEKYEHIRQEKNLSRQELSRNDLAD